MKESTARLIRGSVLGLGVAACIPVVVLTISSLRGAGAAVFRDFGLETFAYAWPTSVAILLVLLSPVVWPKTAAPRWQAVIIASAIATSMLLYALPGSGVGVGSVGLVLALAITAAAPVLLVVLVRLLADRAALRPATRMVVLVACGIVAVWFTAPLGLVAGCLLAAACP